MWSYVFLRIELLETWAKLIFNYHGNHYAIELLTLYFVLFSHNTHVWQVWARFVVL